jgi:hypothetical protein|tara:strand:- start:150 stop:629 length:480 start_codon:yes stop_codon:yes gene_type:complete
MSFRNAKELYLEGNLIFKDSIHELSSLDLDIDSDSDSDSGEEEEGKYIKPKSFSKTKGSTAKKVTPKTVSQKVTAESVPIVKETSTLLTETTFPPKESVSAEKTTPILDETTLETSEEILVSAPIKKGLSIPQQADEEVSVDTAGFSTQKKERKKGARR